MDQKNRINVGSNIVQQTSNKSCENQEAKKLRKTIQQNNWLKDTLVTSYKLWLIPLQFSTKWKNKVSFTVFVCFLQLYLFEYKPSEKWGRYSLAICRTSSVFSKVVTESPAQKVNNTFWFNKKGTQAYRVKELTTLCGNSFPSSRV